MLTRSTAQPKNCSLVLPSLVLPCLVLVSLVLGGCSSAAYRQEADDQVYGILQTALKAVTGNAKTFRIERPVDTLRKRLLTRKEAVVLNLRDTLDVAAENSRDFQRQKEVLFLAGLSLTREQHDFALRYAGGGTADVDGVSNDDAIVSFREDLSASMNLESGGRLVASFFNSWFRDILTSGGWAADSVLSLTFTQPLMRGFGERIARAKAFRLSWKEWGTSQRDSLPCAARQSQPVCRPVGNRSSSSSSKGNDERTEAVVGIDQRETANATC